MKTLMTLALAATAATGLATAVIAQTYSPPGTIALASNGPITVSKGITLRCTLSGSGTIAANGGAAQVNSLTLSGAGLCGSVRFVGLPYPISASSTTSITLNNVQVTATTGNCAGSLTGAFNQATGQITFNGAQIPSSGAGGPCTVNGSVNTSPAVTYTVP